MTQSAAADDRGARQGKGHRARGHHHRPSKTRVVTASRKYYKTTRTCTRASTPRPARSSCSRVKQIVAEVDEPGDARSRSAEAQRALRRRGRSRHGDRVPEADRGPRPHRRADRQAGHLPEGPRGRAREHLRRVQPARRRGGQRHGQALRERRHHRRDRPHRGACCRARNSRAPRATPPATACAPSSRASTAAPRARRSSCRAPTRRCSSSCSSRKCRRSTTAP